VAVSLAPLLDEASCRGTQGRRHGAGWAFPRCRPSEPSGSSSRRERGISRVKSVSWAGEEGQQACRKRRGFDPRSRRGTCRARKASSHGFEARRDGRGGLQRAARTEQDRSCIELGHHLPPELDILQFRERQKVRTMSPPKVNCELLVPTLKGVVPLRDRSYRISGRTISPLTKGRPAGS